MNPTTQLQRDVAALTKQLDAMLGVVTELPAEQAVEIVAGFDFTGNATGIPNKQQTKKALAVLEALWPYGLPNEMGRHDWWRTDLGVLLAGAASPAYNETRTTLGEASKILGASISSINTRRRRGSLKNTAGGDPSLGHVLWDVYRFAGTTSRERGQVMNNELNIGDVPTNNVAIAS